MSKLENEGQYSNGKFRKKKKKKKGKRITKLKL